jgi:hypothetical protein
MRLHKLHSSGTALSLAQSLWLAPMFVLLLCVSYSAQVLDCAGANNVHLLT